MRTPVLIGAVLMALLSGCAAHGPTRALATPWGVGGVHSFGPQPMREEASAAEVNAQVARLLEEDRTPGTRMAAR
jgi:hypothetical protein